MRKIIASLDMGSNSLKLVVGEFMKNKLNILAVSECTTEGIECGFVVDKKQVVHSLKSVFQKAEDMIGLPIRKVIASVPSQDAALEISEGLTTIHSEDHLIKSSDIIRAMQAASYNRISIEEELAAIIPTGFKINDDEIVSNPLKMIAEQLKVKTLLVTVPRRNVHPLIECIEQIGVQVIDITVSALGDYFSIRNNSMKDKIGTIINMGKDTTTVSIFNKGILLNTAVLELGGQNIDNDLAYVYKISKKEAKQIKENLCLAHKRMASPSRMVEVTNQEGENLKINQYEASDIASSRLEEILKLAKKQINLLTKKEIHYIIITGGLTEMTDFSLILEEVFGHSAKIASLNYVGARNNKYSAAVGFIKYYENKMRLRNKEFSIYTLEEQEELSSLGRKINFSDNSILGKLFGYFFDN